MPTIGALRWSPPMDPKNVRVAETEDPAVGRRRASSRCSRAWRPCPRWGRSTVCHPSSPRREQHPRRRRRRRRPPSSSRRATRRRRRRTGRRRRCGRSARCCHRPDPGQHPEHEHNGRQQLRRARRQTTLHLAPTRSFRVTPMLSAAYYSSDSSSIAPRSGRTPLPGSPRPNAHADRPTRRGTRAADPEGPRRRG